MITLHLDVPPRWTYPDRRVDAIRGCVAIERGPLVYCFEQADQPPNAGLDDLALVDGAALRERTATLPRIGPTVVIDADAASLRPPGPGGPGGLPYTTQPPPASGDPVTATAVPYFQWDNRDGRAMRVWLPRSGAIETR